MLQVNNIAVGALTTDRLLPFLVVEADTLALSAESSSQGAQIALTCDAIKLYDSYSSGAAVQETFISQWLPGKLTNLPLRQYCKLSKTRKLSRNHQHHFMKSIASLSILESERSLVPSAPTTIFVDPISGGGRLTSLCNVKCKLRSSLARHFCTDKKGTWAAIGKSICKGRSGHSSCR